MNVSFVDIAAQHSELREPLEEAVRAVIEQSAFSGGPFVERFEKRFAAALGSRYCVSVSSGTAALHLAFAALGLGPGDDVLVPSSTFFATPEAVSLCGARPVFVECDDYYHIDVAAAEGVLTPRTRAIVPVHLYGQPADMDAVTAFAGRHGLLVVEDCAQSHFAGYHGRSTGTFGSAGCFSFYPSKNLGTFGEGGAVVTDDAELAARMRSLRNHGSIDKYTHARIGFNYRMGGIEASVLDVKLDRVAAWNRTRQEAAEQYLNGLRGLPSVTLPLRREGSDHVWHLFPILVPDRGALQEFLGTKGVQTGVHYPRPCHLQPAYCELGYRPGSLPRSEYWAQHVLSLPIHGHLRACETRYVCECIREFCGAD